MGRAKANLTYVPISRLASLSGILEADSRLADPLATVNNLFDAIYPKEYIANPDVQTVKHMIAVSAPAMKEEILTLIPRLPVLNQMEDYIQAVVKANIKDSENYEIFASAKINTERQVYVSPINSSKATEYFDTDPHYRALWLACATCLDYDLKEVEAACFAYYKVQLNLSAAISDLGRKVIDTEDTLSKDNAKNLLNNLVRFS